MRIGGILTAMVTPFDRDGKLDEDAAVRLMHHLLENGSDGLVVAGTTGESPTLSDNEKCRLWELAVSECPDDAVIVAGTGSNDTRHTVELTERATEIGLDAMLVVTPYYTSSRSSRPATRTWRRSTGSTCWPATTRCWPR
jgi:4-hydroxy-tetrahydrodipicolinate synthase